MKEDQTGEDGSLGEDGKVDVKKRLAEIKRFERILRTAGLSVDRGGSCASERLGPMRDVVEEMARNDRG